MLKPITEEEKAKFTLCVQADKARDELLAEVYESGYEGYLDIWGVVSRNKKKKLVLDVKCAKVMYPNALTSHPDAARYHVAQGKGVKKLK